MLMYILRARYRIMLVAGVSLYIEYSNHVYLIQTRKNIDFESHNDPVMNARL